MGVTVEVECGAREGDDVVRYSSGTAVAHAGGVGPHRRGGAAVGRGAAAALHLETLFQGEQHRSSKRRVANLEPDIGGAHRATMVDRKRKREVSSN